MGGTDYYLVCDDSPSYTLEMETTDDWGITWQCCTSVIKGFYYEHLKDNPLKNKMIKKHMTLVPSMSVVYTVETNVKSKQFVQLFVLCTHYVIVPCVYDVN